MFKVSGDENINATNSLICSCGAENSTEKHVSRIRKALFDRKYFYYMFFYFDVKQ